MILARKALSLLDLTSLNDDDTDETVEALAQLAANRYGAPAALCVHAPFVATARATLDQLGLPRVKVVTVVNFPSGGRDIRAAVAETAAATAAGANEIDMVLPWRALKEGDRVLCIEMVAAVRQAMRDMAPLKVIIESGMLNDPALIADACEIAIEAGADFIKTSTGKVAVNATIPAASVILNRIRVSGRDVGFKAAGGVRSLRDAKEYLDLAAEVMGEDWITPGHFRFGASGLLNDIIRTMGGETAAQAESDY